ncbi:MAG: hypothetical protein KAJ58_00930 [Candidatus Pacebacteria bacterium]|nr:hypothetical protein [Candidatus Paceibacterota bacterium]
MKGKLVLLSILVFVFSLFLCNSVFADWHKLTQEERDNFIIQRAYGDQDKFVGESCKEWVRTVIKSASKKAVIIPPTITPKDSCWYNSPNITIATKKLCAVQIGHVLQMDLARSRFPHTAIVIGKGLYGLVLIEANWDRTPADGTDAYVRRRYVSFTTFNNQVESFTAYNIL